MDLLTNNQVSVKDTNFNITETVVIKDYEDNYQTLAAWATGILLDFGHITNPIYLKLTASVPVNLTMWWNTINNVYNYEVHGEITAITIDNSSGADESKVQFLVANEV